MEKVPKLCPKLLSNLSFLGGKIHLAVGIRASSRRHHPAKSDEKKKKGGKKEIFEGMEKLYYFRQRYVRYTRMCVWQSQEEEEEGGKGEGV